MEDAPTEITRRLPGSIIGSRGSSTTGLVRNPHEALRLEEIGRARVFAGFVAVLTLLTAAILPFLGGDPLAKKVHFGGAMLGFVSALWTLWHVRDPNRYEPRVTVYFGYCCAAAVATGYFYWGVHSAVMLLVPIGIYFFALGESRAAALSTLAICLLPHLFLSVSTMLGLAGDRGLVRPFEDDQRNMAGVSLLVQFICIAAYVMARGLRRWTIETMEQLDQAAREVAQRNALLAEARQDLDRALKIGGPGRLTGLTVGSFQLGHVLGRGAIGDVYEAVQQPGGRRVAVKLLQAASGTDPNRVARFRREIEIAAALEAPNLVEVIEVADEEATVPYLAMERLEGQNLAELLRQRHRLVPAEVADMIAELGTGVEAAHAAGVVHRDLKPQNVFRHRRADGRSIWKILDFGVSQLADHDGTLTRGQVVGTPTYMAPEQARGLRVDHRADLYSLGVIAYRALVGQPPFTGMDVPATLHAVVYDMPPQPSEASSLSPTFDVVLAVALAKEPDDRFQTAAELAEALRAAARGSVDRRLEARARHVLNKDPWAQRGR